MQLELMRTIAPRCLIGGSILLVHLVLLSAFTSLAFRARDVDRTGAPAEFIATAQIIVQAAEWDKVPLPEVRLDSVPVDVNAPRLVQFDGSDQDELAGIIAPASAPRLARFQSADVTDFARRAGVLPGHPVTVVLTVEVGIGGRADAVDIVRGSGRAAVDAAAVDYALSLRWIPGTVARDPRLMRVRVPVTLSVTQ